MNLKKGRVLQSLLASGLLATGLIALLHLMGRAYYAGYLRAWGLPFEFMPLTNESMLEQGAYALMGMGAALCVRLLVSSILVATLVGLAQHARDKLVRHSAVSRREQSRRGGLFRFTIDAGGVMAIAFAIFFAFLLTMNASTRVGEEQAQRDAACSRCGQSELMLADHVSVRGRVIRCSGSHCIVQSADQVLVLRLEDIQRLTLPQAAEIR